jgi:tetratricopeptide (TPR) repeat protein
MIRSAVACVVLCVGLSAAVPSFAQGRGGSGMRAGDSFKNTKPAAWRGAAEVAGKITDDAGHPVAEAKVTFVLAELNEGFFATTKKNGEFSAKDIKPGEWRIQVEAPDFITVRQTLTVGEKKTPLTVQLKRDNSPELLTKADALFKEGKNADARVEYMKVLEAHPDLAGINRAIAYTYGKEGNHPEALKYLDLALAGNPNDTVLLQLAAASATTLNDFPRAMAYLARIDEASLDNPSVLADAAVNLINKRRTADGIALLDRVIARFPDAPDAYFYRGFAKAQASQNAEAKVDLEKYLTLAPADSPQAAKAREILAALK